MRGPFARNCAAAEQRNLNKRHKYPNRIQAKKKLDERYGKLVPGNKLKQSTCIWPQASMFSSLPVANSKVSQNVQKESNLKGTRIDIEAYIKSEHKDTYMCARKHADA